MCVVSAILLMQYIHFKSEAEKMLAVREEYYRYLLKMKKSIQENNFSALSEDYDSGDDKYDSGDDKKDAVQIDFQESFLEESIDLPNVKDGDHAFMIEKSVDDSHGFQVLSAEDEKQIQSLKKQLAQKAIVKPKLKKSSAANSSIRQLQKIVKQPANQDFAFHWPLELHHFWISSLFGPRAKTDGTPGFHYGVDLAALKGTPVKTAASGVVVQAQYISGYGNNILIQHNKNYRTRYAHLNSIGVKVGDRVQAGKKIGTVGDTGFVRKSGRDASHLHFEIYKNGRHVNPLRYLFN